MKVPPIPSNKSVVKNSRTRLSPIKSRASKAQIQDSLTHSNDSHAPISSNSSHISLPSLPPSIRVQPSSIKQYFTPHIIHLWLKNLESIVHLNEAWNKRLNEDFTSWQWSAIIYRPPQVVKKISDLFLPNKRETEDDICEFGNTSKPFISRTLTHHYMDLLNIERNLADFDPSFALLWDKNVLPPQAYQPYKVHNSVDNDVIPYLKYTLENLINWKVKSPDDDFNYGCDCEDNCQIFKTPNKGWGVRTLAAIKEGSFVMEHVGEILESRTAKLREVCYGKLDMLTYFDLDFGFDESRKSSVLW
ncbi:11618_t:CDS:2 [Acaulospora colombiana]|uniref:11618_t:CDS:1 n=1 Tax=Acaulospora colombiana TaxID=27376 RepID=A0ACA9K1C0_9GLOM|nr:11618_t:CDS:2 [Acaulospora colombiana]